MGRNGPKGNNHFRVDSNAIIQQGSDNLSDQGDVFGGEQR